MPPPRIRPIDSTTARVLGITPPEEAPRGDSGSTGPQLRVPVPAGFTAWVRRHARRVGPPRIWYAGCARGEALYTLAMLLARDARALGARDARVLATDASETDLQVAVTGVYPEGWAAALPDTMRMRYVRPHTEVGFVEVTRPLRRIVRFAPLRLSAAWPFAGPFDAILCPDRAAGPGPTGSGDLTSRFRTVLAPGGRLFLGATRAE